jgi:transposase-like protein
LNRGGEKVAAKHRKYTKEFKREAVRLMESSGKPIAEPARDLGINDNNLYWWRGVYGSQSQVNPSGTVASFFGRLKHEFGDVCSTELKIIIEGSAPKIGNTLAIKVRGSRANSLSLAQ